MSGLKKAFEDRCISIQAFAQKHDIPQSVIYAACNGQTRIENMPVTRFMKIAHGLGMTVEELYAEITAEDDGAQ